MAHHHDGDRCPLCPTDDMLAGMRARNRETARVRREGMLTRVAADPSAYVHAVEARSEGDADIVMHVATTVERARAYCMSQPERDYLNDLRYHILPHRLDAPDEDKTTGVVSVAVYGVRPGATAIEDLVGTDDE